MSHAPTLINLPPPPSDPVTPSDVPGTPTSTTTSMSELSTVAIKDGHRGHLPHHHHHHHPNQPPTSSSGVLPLPSQLDAERADRISRLAGLERVVRPPHTPSAPPPYFDSTGNPALGRERSTVGSASATGSVGARTTWAGSEGDKMSEVEGEDMDTTSSVGGLSEDGGEMVGFGEGARTPARTSTPTMGREAARMIDGVTYDANVVDTTMRGGTGRREAERIVRANMDTTSNDRMRRGRESEAGKGGGV